MPGGPRAAYESLAPVLTRIAAQEDMDIRAFFLGDARTVPVIAALALLERAGTAAGAQELLTTYGFGSAADVASLAAHRV